MDKRAVFLLLLLAVFLAFTISGTSRDSEKVNVVVYFKDSPEPEIGHFGVQSVSVSNAKNIAQIRAFSGDRIGVKRQFLTMNGFVGEVDREYLEMLKSNPNMEVYESVPVHTFLSDSVNLVNASRTWGLVHNGTNITGNGETVCVIDSGVNETHPALSGRVIEEYCFCDGGGAGCCPNGQGEDSDGTDDYGHGTHVAGIIASKNATYPGVAPDASIISVKVTDSSGNGISTDVVSAIDWCVNLSYTHNVSVISMSLGGGLYSSYCDGESGVSAYAKPINNATFYNITVVASSGNSGVSPGVGSKTQIAAPACIQNATAVGSSTKSDAVSGFSNRNAITDLFAPGSSITSLRWSPDSCLAGCSCNDAVAMACSGTSMATPHVSGAAALIRQYLKVSEDVVANSTLVIDALNSTGIDIDDTGAGGSGVVFRRISIFDAVNAYDSDAPNLTFVEPTPENDSTASNNNSIFVNITGSEILTAASLEWSNGSVANYSMNGDGVNWNINFSTPLLVNVSYRVFANDSAGNIGFTETWYLSFNNTVPVITSFFPSGSVLNITEPANQTFNVSYTDAEGDSVNVTWLQNGSVVSYDAVNFTFLGNLTASSETVNSTYNITAQVSDGINITYVNWTLAVENNYAPVLASVANITVNETDWVNLTLTAVDSNGDLLNFSVNDTPFNASGADSVSANFTWLTNLTSSGVFQMEFNVTDGYNSDTESFNVTVIDSNDFDGDGIPDIYDDDDDNDGIPDGEDSILGNITSLVVNTAALSVLNVTINGTDNYSMVLSVPVFVNITNGSRSLAAFVWNFSASTISLNQTFEVENASSTGGYMLVKGLSLPSGQTKNVTVSNINDNINSVCIRDAEINSIGDVSASCDQANETLLECPGSSGQYSCALADSDTLYSVSGLAFSGVIEQCRDADGDSYGVGCAAGADCDDGDSSRNKDCSAASVASSGGGGGGGGGGGSAKAVVSDSVSRFFKMIEKGAVAEFKTGKQHFSIQKIRFTALSQLKSVTLEVEKINSSQAPSELDNAFHYFKISADFGNDLIDNVVFDFRVDKSWFVSGSLDKDSVLMQRNANGRWVALPTSFAGEGNVFYNYTSTSPGFSYFAVTAKPLPPVIEKKAEENVSVSVTNISGQINVSETGVLEAEKAEGPESWLPNPIFILFVIVSAFALLVIGRAMKRKIRRKRQPHHHKHGWERHSGNGKV